MQSDFDLLSIPAYYLYMLHKVNKHIRFMDITMIIFCIVCILVCVYFSINPVQVHDVMSFAACAGI